MEANPKKRNCPVVGRIIRRDECGENRISKYDCPDDCPFNPFAPANYDQLLEIETRLDGRLMERLRGERGLAEVFEKALVRMDSLENPDLELGDLLCRLLFVEKTASGATLAGSLLEEKPGSLKNDERILLKAKAGLHIGLLEVRGVIDDRLVRVVDLLRPERAPYLVCDRALAARTPRFKVYFGWIYSLKHFDRATASLGEWLDLGMPAPDSFREVCRHLGAPVDAPADLDEWLKMNFLSVFRAAANTASERSRLMIERIDARFGKAHYRSTGPLPEDPADLFARQEGIEPEDDLSEDEVEAGYDRCWVWLEPESPDWMPGLGRPIAGRILTNGGDWRVEASSGTRFERIRQRFESILGQSVEFVSERVDDLASRFSQGKDRLPEEERAMVPPVLLETIPTLGLHASRIDRPGTGGPELEGGRPRGFSAAALRNWVDARVPALGGKTPREAARMPEHRARLVEMVKRQVCDADEEALHEGCVAEVDWIFGELGLEEIRSRTPPLRKQIGPEEKDGGANEGVPALSVRGRLSDDEALAREDLVFACLGEEGDSSDPVLSPCVRSALDSLISYIEDESGLPESDVETMANLAVPTLYAITGTEGFPDCDFSVEELKMEAAGQFDLLLRVVDRNQEEEARFRDWFERCEQPGLLRTFMGRMRGFMDEGPAVEDAITFNPLALVLAASLINVLERRRS